VTVSASHTIPILPTLYHRLFYTTLFFRILSPSVSSSILSLSLDVGLAARRAYVEQKLKKGNGNCWDCYILLYFWLPGRTKKRRLLDGLFFPISIRSLRTHPLVIATNRAALETIQPNYSENRKLTRVSKYPAPPNFNPIFGKYDLLLPSSRSTRDLPDISFNQLYRSFNIFYLQLNYYFRSICFQSIYCIYHSQLPSQTPVVSQIPSHLPIIPSIVPC